MIGANLGGRHLRTKVPPVARNSVAWATARGMCPQFWFRGQPMETPPLCIGTSLLQATQLKSEWWVGRTEKCWALSGWVWVWPEGVGLGMGGIFWANLCTLSWSFWTFVGRDLCAGEDSLLSPPYRVMESEDSNEFGWGSCATLTPCLKVQFAKGKPCRLGGGFCGWALHVDWPCFERCIPMDFVMLNGLGPIGDCCFKSRVTARG